MNAFLIHKGIRKKAAISDTSGVEINIKQIIQNYKTGELLLVEDLNFEKYYEWLMDIVKGE